MRTKLVLGAAILAAGAISSVAANVYSLNVVGYVNKSFGENQFAMVTSPLNTTNNSLASIFPAPPEGTGIYIWDSTVGDFTANYNFAGGVWDNPSVTFKPGQGLFVYSPAAFVNTFVGEVPQGALSQPILGNAAFSIIGSMVPVGGDVTTVMTGYPAVDGDGIYQWDSVIGDFAANANYAGGVWAGSITQIGVAEAFLLFSGGPNSTWTRNFTVQ